MRIEFDNTVTLVTPESEGELEVYCIVRDELKTMAPAARYMYQHKLWLQTKGQQGWDGKTSIVSKPHPTNKKSFFPTGILPVVYTKMVDKMPRVRYTFTDMRIKSSCVPGSYTVKLRNYQAEALDDALNNKITLGASTFDWPAGILQIATGGGKTELAVAMCQAVPVPTVFIVHRKHLVTQAIERFDKYGIIAGKIGDGVFNPNPKGVTVATVQTIHNLFKEGDSNKINQFVRAEQVFFDEAHLCASKISQGNQLVNVARQFRAAYYRWGLTATPFMKDEYSNQLLQGCTGDKLCVVSNKQLINQGHLTPPRIKIISVPDVGGVKTWPEVYDVAIVLNNPRNNRIIAELKAAPKPAMVMCTRLSHAKVIHNMAKSQGFNLPAIQHGGTPNKERARILEDLQNGTEKAIIATTIYDEGVDVPNLRTLILAGGGKSTVAQLQRIGRGLRKHANKHEVLVIDFDDNTGQILKRHSKMRRKVWQDEGFTIEETE